MVVKGNIWAASGSRAAGNQDLRRFEANPFTVAFNFHCMGVEKMRGALMNGNPVALELCPNNLSLARDNGVYTGGDILDGHVDTTLRSIAVQGLYGEAGELKDGLTYRLTGDCAGVNAHAADHDRPIDNGDALARLRRCDSALLSRWATT